jgi:hypothetical protein
MNEEEHDDDFNDDKTYDGKQYDPAAAAVAAANDNHNYGRVGECDYDANNDRKCRKF